MPSWASRAGRSARTPPWSMRVTRAGEECLRCLAQLHPFRSRPEGRRAPCALGFDGTRDRGTACRRDRVARSRCDSGSSTRPLGWRLTERGHRRDFASGGGRHFNPSGAADSEAALGARGVVASDALSRSHLDTASGRMRDLVDSGRVVNPVSLTRKLLLVLRREATPRAAPSCRRAGVRGQADGFCRVVESIRWKRRIERAAYCPSGEVATIQHELRAHGDRVSRKCPTWLRPARVDWQRCGVRPWLR